MKFNSLTLSCLLSSFLISCSVSAKTLSKNGTLYDLPQLNVSDFNRLAKAEDISLVWEKDKNNNGQIDPDEVIYTAKSRFPELYVRDGAFSHSFESAYRKLVERKRQEIVAQELAQGRPTEILTDFTTEEFSDKDRTFVKHIVKVAEIIEELFMIQNGNLKYKRPIYKYGTEDDIKLYERNQGITCDAPETIDSPFCSAISFFPHYSPPKLDAYPQDLNHDSEMCEMFKKTDESEKDEDKKLLSHFSVVRRKGEGFIAIPYSKVYYSRMKKISDELEAASKIYDKGDGEEALNAYLKAAARAFITNDWVSADEPWVKMNSENSRWFLRVAPDEVYGDLCKTKAGFQLKFGLASRKSRKWKEIMVNEKQEMEQRLADLIGPPYKARKIDFKTPDFVEVIMDAGEARSPTGAITGASLPNWGRVAQAGRRTITFTNFYTDPLSMEFSRKKGKLLFTDSVLKYFNPGRETSSLNTTTHEATHNYGPHTDYKVDGKTPREIYGNITNVLEEFKAQTGAIWYLRYLYEKGYLTYDQLMEAYIANIYWGCINNMSRGLFYADGTPKAHQQTGTIQFGKFMEDGAIKKLEVGDSFLLDIDFEQLHKSVEELMKIVGEIKGKGDAKRAHEFVDHYIVGAGYDKVLMDEITKRYRSFPKESFFFTIKVD